MGGGGGGGGRGMSLSGLFPLYLSICFFHVICTRPGDCIVHSLPETVLVALRRILCHFKLFLTCLKFYM